MKLEYQHYIIHISIDRMHEVFVELFRKSCSTGSFILVLDERTLPVLQKALTKFELTEEGCGVIESLSNKDRATLSDAEVIYFIEPNKKNIDLLLEDFSMIEPFYKASSCCDKLIYGDIKLPAQKIYKYDRVHLIFQGGLNDTLFGRIKGNKILLDHLVSLKEINTDFLVIERNVFSLGQLTALEHLFGSKGDGPGIIRAISRQLMNLCVTMNEYPFIRFKKGYPCEDIAKNFQLELDNYQRLHEKWEFHKDRATLFIIDRTNDIIAPFLHEFSYQAMAQDLLPISNDTYKYKTETGKGEVEKTAVLNDSDKMWNRFKHTFIIETQRQLQAELKVFLEENKAFTKTEGMDLETLNKTMGGLQEYQANISVFARHITIAKACMSVFEKQKLHPSGLLEQTLATGFDQDKKNVKVDSMYKNLQMRFADPDMPIESKCRLLALFLITQDGIKEDWRRKLVEIGKIESSLESALGNLRLLGVNTMTDKTNAKRSSMMSSNKGTKGSDESMLSRFTPVLKEMLIGEVNRTLSQDDYPYIVEPPPLSKTAQNKSTIGFTANIASSSGVAAVSRRTRKPGTEAKTNSWAAAKVEEKHTVSAGRCILFIAGGMTYSEMRVAAEVEKETNSEIILGSTHVITPKIFFENLKSLDPEMRLDLL